jgi:recombination protein RecT
MSVATTQQKPVSQQDMLRNQLTKMSDEFKAALPSHIKPEKFQRVVMTVVQQSPDLLAADRRSLLGSCMKCAADGLVPDGREAALVIFNTKTKDGGWEKKVQYMPMLAGIQKRIRNSGEVASIEAHVIYSNDEFVWRQGLDGTIVHNPKFPGPRGDAIGAYAVARFKDGSLPQYEVMDVDEINRVRAVSKSKDSGPWVQWWSEMARKTVFRRLSKWLPMDADVDDILQRDDEYPNILEGKAEAAPSNATKLPPSSKLETLEDAMESDEDGVVYEGEIESPSDKPLPKPFPLPELEACRSEAELKKLMNSDGYVQAMPVLSIDVMAQVTAAVTAAHARFA